MSVVGLVLNSVFLPEQCGSRMVVEYVGVYHQMVYGRRLFYVRNIISFLENIKLFYSIFKITVPVTLQEEYSIK